MSANKRRQRKPLRAICGGSKSWSVWKFTAHSTKPPGNFVFKIIETAFPSRNFSRCVARQHGLTAKEESKLCLGVSDGLPDIVYAGCSVTRNCNSLSPFCGTPRFTLMNSILQGVYFVPFPSLFLCCTCSGAVFWTRFHEHASLPMLPIDFCLNDVLRFGGFASPDR